MPRTDMAAGTRTDDAAARATLAGRNLTFEIDGARLLDGVSVAFPVGRLSLILGANGAGKSTLIRALCGHCLLYTSRCV